jgi:hypothetical protein
MPLTRARDLRANIKDYGFERGIVMTMEGMLDEVAELRQHMKLATELLSRCIDEVDKLSNIGGQMQKVIDQMRRERQQGDEHGDAS